MSDAPFCYPPSGNALIIADGPELLVYSGHNDAPLWKEFCATIVVGVGAYGNFVVSLDADGLLRVYRAFDGAVESEMRLDTSPLGMVVDEDGTAAILVDDGVLVMRPGQEPVRFEMSGACTVAFGPSSAALGVGTRHGVFYAVDATTGGAWGSVSLSAGIGGVAWLAQGHWVVTSGSTINVIAGDGSAVLQTFALPEGAASMVAATSDGSLIAAVVDGTNVAAYEMHTRTPVGQVTTDQLIGGLSFGPEAWLAIGLEGGDCNRIDLLTGKLNKTEPHFGRAANKWLCSIKFDHLRIRGSVTGLRAGGAPIAMKVDPKVKNEQTQRSWITYVLGCFGLIFVCGLCTGVLGTAYALFGGMF